jgi:hypothetical protein
MHYYITIEGQGSADEIAAALRLLADKIYISSVEEATKITHEGFILTYVQIEEI